MQENSDAYSSDPSTTTYSDYSGSHEESTPGSVTPEEVPDAPTLKNKGIAITQIVFLDLIIPILYMLNTIAVLGVVGMLFSTILIIHIVVLNFSNKSFHGIKIMVFIGLVITIITFLFTLNNIDDLKILSLFFRITGLHFHNCVSKSSIFCMVNSIILIVVFFVILYLFNKSPIQDFIFLRRKFFRAHLYIYFRDIIWSICVAYIGATSSCYLFTPLLLYFAYTMIVFAIAGRRIIWRLISIVVYLWSLIFALYLLYEISYKGESWSLAAYVRFEIISSPKVDGLLAFISVFFSFISVHMISTKVPSMALDQVPEFIVEHVGVFIVVVYALIVFYTIFFPSFISVLILLLCFITSFLPVAAIKKGMFAFTAIVYNIGILVSVGTSYKIFEPKNMDQSTLNLLKSIGLYRYLDDFSFTICSFMLSVVIGQVGRMIHFKPIVKISTQPETEPKSKAFEILKSILMWLKKMVIYLVIVVRHLAMAAIFSIAITFAYYEERGSFQILFAFALFITLLGLFSRWSFELLKFISGLILLITMFYYSSLIKGVTFRYIDQFGLTPTKTDILFYQIWPILLVYSLSVLVSKDEQVRMKSSKSISSGFIFFLIFVAQILLVFCFKTTVFTWAYSLLSIATFGGQIAQKRFMLIFSSLLSNICIAIHLLLYMGSEFDSIRNFLSSLIPSTIFDMSTPARPSIEIWLLSITLFLTSMANGAKLSSYSRGWLVDGLLEELKSIARSFYFYISWILIFGFALSNNYPTVIRFLLVCIFLLGSKMSRVFKLITKPFFIFMILFVSCQFLFEIYPPIIPDSAQKYCRYAGIYFGSDTGTIKGRNVPLAWQMGFLIFTIIYMVSAIPNETDKRFSNSIGMRIYTALYSMLHFFLPAIVEISLFISTLFNPSVFGYFFLVVLVLVAYNRTILEKGAWIITIIFNLFLAAQYFMWLGLPDGKIHIGLPLKWGEFFGIVNVSNAALLTNCISALIFTFYIEFYSLFVDYDDSYEKLPEIFRKVINFFVSYSVEFFTSMIIVAAINVPSFDGFLFFLLAATLFVASLLFGYNHRKMLQVLSMGSFFILAGKMLSRIPVFIDQGVGELVRRCFDLPFSGTAVSEVKWIVIFAIERTIVGIMNSDNYKKSIDKRTRLQAFRFIRSRQLDVITKMDQEILKERYRMKIEEIVSTADMTKNSEHLANIGSSIKHQSSPEADIEDINESDDEESKYNWVLRKFIYPMFSKFFILISKSIPLNNEPGVNVLTLDSIIHCLRKELGALKKDRSSDLNTVEISFLKELPPAFIYHFNSLSLLIGAPKMDPKNFPELFVRAFGIFLRRMSFILFVLIIVIYAFMRPYIWSSILIVFSFIFFISYNPTASISLHTLLLAWSLFICGLKSLSNADMLRQILTEAAKSVPTEQMAINILSLVGMNPAQSNTIEIAVFLIITWFIVDRSANCRINMPSHYFDHFKELIPGFPERFCYNDQFVEQRLMLKSKSPSVFKSIKSGMMRVGLFDSNHQIWALFGDILSFIFLLCLYPTWIKDKYSSSQTSIGASYVFSLVIQVVMSILCYYWKNSGNCLNLYITHNVWLLYTIICVFFVIPSQSRTIIGSLQFFIVLRLFVHLVYSHYCSLGKTVLDFKYPDLKKDSTGIYYMNKFIRVIPFVFEIQSILNWISQKTYVSFKDFLIVRDIKSQLECLMINQYKKRKQVTQDKKANEISRRYTRGGCMLFWLLFILFVPLFFMVDSSESGTTNDPIDIKLELGFTSMQPLWIGFGTIREITSAEHQQIANSNIASLKDLVYARKSSLSLVTFSMQSGCQWFPFNETNSPAISQFRDSSSVLTPYVKLKSMLSIPTTTSKSASIDIQQNYLPLSEAQKASWIAAIDEGSTAEFASIPIIFRFPSGSSASFDSSIKERIRMNHVSKFWTISVTADVPIAFLEPDGNLRCLIYSQPVLSGLSSSLISSNATMIVFYLLIVLTFGFVLRVLSLSGIDDLWLDRMERPGRLYRIVISIDALRTAGDTEKELELTQHFLDLLRSRESVIELTNSRIDNKN